MYEIHQLISSISKIAFINLEKSNKEREEWSLKYRMQEERREIIGIWKRKDSYKYYFSERENQK